MTFGTFGGVLHVHGGFLDRQLGPRALAIGPPASVSTSAIIVFSFNVSATVELKHLRAPPKQLLGWTPSSSPGFLAIARRLSSLGSPSASGDVMLRITRAP